MADPRQTLLAEISEHLSLAAQHSARATALLNMLHDQAPALGPIPTMLPDSAVGGALLSSNPHSLNVWAEWLAEHGPSLRQDVWDGTGLNLATGAMKNVITWKGPMTMWADGAVLPTTVCRIQGLSEARGRPPTVYFLWSQRWDVHPLFGVGPIKPEPSDLDAFGLPANEWDEPTDEPEPSGVYVGATAVPELPTTHLATMDEWNERWHNTMRSIAASGIKPDDELKQQMIETLPESVDPGPALALAYSAAARQAPVLGVIAPPEPEPDRTGWQMVGPHYHAPHAWGELCRLSGCVRAREEET